MKRLVFNIVLVCVVLCVVSAVTNHARPSYTNRPKLQLQSKTINKTSSITIQSNNVDTCYESVNNIQHSNQVEGESSRTTTQPLRGLEKTLATFEGVLSSKDQRESMHLPPSLIRAFGHTNKHDETSKGKTVQTVICPNAEEIFPCNCDEHSQTFNCSATGNFTRIREIFQTTQFKDTSFTTFLNDGSGEHLESETVLLNNTFGTVTFQEVVLENTQLQVVEANAFNGSEHTLRIIRMQHNVLLHTFPFTYLHRFNQLTEVKLGFGNLEHIPTLNTVSHLFTLLLNSNHIQSIQAQAFVGLPELGTLDLGKNDLVTLHTNEFDFSATDVLLYLDDNFISNIEDDTFGKEQPSLLELYHNSMTTLNSTVFQPILDNIIEKQYDTYVDVEENPLCCQDIAWVLDETAYHELIDLPTLDCTHTRQAVGTLSPLVRSP